MKRYAIWDKKSPVITPVGEVLTPQQWMERHPVAGLDTVTVVCAAGEVNGGFFGTLGQMVSMYAAQGADFSGAATDLDKLAVIEDYEDSLAGDPTESSPEERIAAALELQNLLALPDENESDPE